MSRRRLSDEDRALWKGFARAVTPLRGEASGGEPGISSREAPEAETSRTASRHEPSKPKQAPSLAQFDRRLRQRVARAGRHRQGPRWCRGGSERTRRTTAASPIMAVPAGVPPLCRQFRRGACQPWRRRSALPALAPRRALADGWRVHLLLLTLTSRKPEKTHELVKFVGETPRRSKLRFGRSKTCPRVTPRKPIPRRFPLQRVTVLPICA